MAHGIPWGFVAALAALVLVAILYTISEREPKEMRGFAEFTMGPEGCSIDTTRALNVRDCQLLGPGVYRVRFTRSLAGSTAFATRGSCCPGPIAASVENDQDVIVTVNRRVRRLTRASVVLP